MEMKMLIALGLSLLSAPLLGAAEPDSFGDATLSEHPEPQVLVSLKDASVKELIAILTRPEKHIRVPDKSVSGFHMVSLWHRSSSLLASHLDEAKPLLAEMLYSEAACVSHDKFNPQHEEELLTAFLEDGSPWVRRLVIANLCERKKDIDQKYQISTALKMCDEDPDKDVRANAMAGVFDVLYRASKDLRADIIGDRGISLPRRMTKALGDEALQGIVVYQTGRLAGEIWHASDAQARISTGASL